MGAFHSLYLHTVVHIIKEPIEKLEYFIKDENID